MNKAALDASSQTLQSAHLLTNRVAVHFSQQSKGSRMKRMLLLLSLVPAIAFSSTPFDGTWKVRLDSMQFSGKPSEQVIMNGSYTCKTCVPPFTIKADGKEQPTPVHNTRDHMSVKVVSPTTVEYTEKVGGKVISTSTDTVSADGNRLTTTFTNYSGEQQFKGTATSKRVGPAPTGAHAVSGAWMQDSVPEVTESAKFFVVQSTDNGIKWTWNGMITDAKFDGKQYAVKNDPSKTLVALKKINDRQFEERGTSEGKVQYITMWTVSADGKTITHASESPVYGTKSSWILEKQP